MHTAIMLGITVVRALTLVGGPLCWLIAVLVAWPTERLFAPDWFLAGCISWAVYAAGTFAFITAGNHHNAEPTGEKDRD